MKNLEKFGVQELTTVEVENIDGGNILPYAFAFALYLMSEWDDVSAGWNDAGSGYNYQP